MASRDPAEDAGMLYADVAEQGVAHTKDPGQQPAIGMGDRVFFLGEAFSLTYVLHDVLAPFVSGGGHGSSSSTMTTTTSHRPRLHCPVPSRPEQTSLSSCGRQEQQAQCLRQRGVYFLPTAAHTRDLLRAYFDWFHPSFPVVDEETLFTAQVEDGTASLLLLNALLMVAVTTCDKTLALASSGPAITHRHQAREVYYRQAKVLYDEDLERDPTDLVAAVFLMSFWWTRPAEPKDSWHWLAVATSLAQSHGMHRW